jgi:transcription initiation factor TFIIH subunit 3
MAVPTQDRIDFRAACFCHKTVVDIGFICSVCLSSEPSICYFELIAKIIVRMYSFLPANTSVFYMPVCCYIFFPPDRDCFRCHNYTAP